MSSELILYQNHFEKVTGEFLLAIQGNPNLGFPEIVNHSDHQQQYTIYILFTYGCPEAL